MRHIFSHRASVKRSSQGKGKVRNMAATGNTTTSAGGVVTVASSGGGGGNSTTSPVPDWTGDPVLLKDFASKRKVPGFARVVKGSYMTIGTSKFSFQKHHHDIYIHSVKVGVKVLAHCMKRVDGPGHRRGQTFTRLYSMDQRLTVPITYQGWFELLSEDGKSARPLATVLELAKAFPVRCLVRENIKGYLSTVEGSFTFDKTKIIPAGEQLKLCGEVSLPAPVEGKKLKLLRCIDTKGDNVFLSFDQKGLFTPIAGENDVVGLFNIRDIVRRFRLPLTVKLAHGVRPRVPDSKFSGLIRLDWVYTEETAFVCPLEKNHVRLLPVPCDVALQLVAANNQEEMCSSEMFKSIQAKCSRMVNNYNNTLHLIVTLPDSLAKTQTRNSRASSNIFSAPLHSSSEGTGRMRRSKSREDMLMDEIDDLYTYVRDGGQPPKSKFQYDSDEESYWEEPAYEPLGEFQARLKALEAGQNVSYPDYYRPADPTQFPGLVGGGGGVVVPSPLIGEAAGGGEWEGEGVLSNGRLDETLSTIVNADPPPLPPRPSANASTNPTPATPTDFPPIPPPRLDPGKDTSRRTPALLQPSFSFHVSSHPGGADSAEGSSKSPQPADTSGTPSADGPPRRVSRSDSEPVTPASALPVTANPKPPPSNKHSQAEAKLDWKERLRRFNAMKDREGQSGAISSNDSQLNVQRLARDFKDSDISSRTKASSGSSGGRGARKRMQTLYL